MSGQGSFLDALLPPGFGRNARLEAIDRLIDWSRLEALVTEVRSGEMGRPPYAPLSMLKALLLQQWYGLSDPGLEEALLDRVSFRRFCGFALDASTPDETTLCRFRNALKDAGLGEALFTEIGRQLEAGGFIVKAGTLIDATLIRSAAKTPTLDKASAVTSQSEVDPDANWTRSGAGRKSFFGYKLHIGVDLGSGLIRTRRLTPAKVYESEVADDLIVGDERAVYADKAYEKAERRKALKARGIKDRILHRRNKHMKELPPWQAKRNKLVATIRANVERSFACLKGATYRLTRFRYYSLKANAFHADLTMIAFNLRRAATLAA
jgi:IS5 family transposase